MMTTRARRSSLVAALALAVSVPASATPTFPGVLQSELGLAETPACTACHVGAFARGTVTTPLGKALLSRRMVAGDEASLRTAIAALVAEKNPAILALKGGATSDVVAPEYGCTCSVTGTPSHGSLRACAAALALAVVARLRVRRRR
jgi:MYXO-CTERM domain-containing protein